jgi:hypothetical protein
MARTRRPKSALLHLPLSNEQHFIVPLTVREIRDGEVAPTFA